jgi:hypothetical protein
VEEYKVEENIIYWEKEDGSIINNIGNYFNNGGVWALYGRKKETKDYICLNVGFNSGRKKTSIGNEILQDIACLTFLKDWNPSTEGTGYMQYINQYAEDCGFYYEKDMQIATLYQRISDNYENFAFVYVVSEANKDIEREYAWSTHALFWRDSRPFKHIEEGYYEKNKHTNVNNSYIEIDGKIRQVLKG